MRELPQHLKGQDFVRIGGWTRDDLATILDLADALKRDRTGEPLLAGRTIGLLFVKPSTRTRVSFSAGIAQLGGTPIPLAASELHLGRGETLRDTATVLSRYLDAIVIRTFAQADVEQLARHAD